MHTQQSRANHFLGWTARVGLVDDPCLPEYDIQARNYLIACFAVSLIRGETILKRQIKHATINGYVKAAVKLHIDRELPSPHHAKTNYIDIVLKAVKKYEKEPDRQHMIDDEMIHHMESIRADLDPDSLEAALIDWIYLGRFVGYRGIEWCQTKQKEDLKIDHPSWTGPPSYAFINDDIEFFNDKKQPLHDLRGKTVDDILYFRLRIKKQKNNRNFEIQPYFKDLDNPQFCPVQAIFRIVQRGQRLDLPEVEPLAVFRAATGRYKGERCFITTNLVAKFLQQVAATVFNLSAKDKALARWTTHSIRVTACNLLHRQGFSDTYIQTRLRWTSQAFLGYLRNTLYTAAKHTKALHIPRSNLPVLTLDFVQGRDAAGNITQTNSPKGIPIVRTRPNEEIESVLNINAASAA